MLRAPRSALVRILRGDLDPISAAMAGDEVSARARVRVRVRNRVRARVRVSFRVRVRVRDRPWRATRSAQMS